jgi:hypothetical protein
MQNLPNEWAVAYHGTKFTFLKPITEQSIVRGGRQAYKGYENINPKSNK